MPNILLIAGINRLCNLAIDKFLTEHNSPNNVLISCMQEECRFDPPIKPMNRIDMHELGKLQFSDLANYYLFPPVDDELLKSISSYEPEVYKMMDSVFPTLTFNARQRIYLDALRYLNGLLVVNQINLFVCFAIPHQIYDYILYLLCKAKGVDIILYYRLPIYGYLYSFTDIENHAPKLKNHYLSLLDKYLDKDIEKVELCQGFRKVFDKHTKEDIIPIPYYMKKKTGFEKLNTFLNLSRRYLKKKTKMTNIISDYILNTNDKRVINKFIQSNAIIPDLSKRFVYIALHYQPEGTTSPMAGVYVNQLLIIQMISYCAPSDVSIYVKEHPNQGRRGSKDLDFYKGIKRLHNVSLIPTDFDTTKLINSCMCVVTATGTIVLEAMLKCKPSIMFGNYITNYGPGVYKVKTISECYAALNSIINENRVHSLKEAKIFLRALQENSFPGEFALRALPFLKENGISDLICNENILEDLRNKTSLCSNFSEIK